MGNGELSPSRTYCASDAFGSVRKISTNQLFRLVDGLNPLGSFNLGFTSSMEVTTIQSKANGELLGEREREGQTHREKHKQSSSPICRSWPAASDQVPEFEIRLVVEGSHNTTSAQLYTAPWRKPILRLARISSFLLSSWNHLYQKLCPYDVCSWRLSKKVYIYIYTVYIYMVLNVLCNKHI